MSLRQGSKVEVIVSGKAMELEVAAMFHSDGTWRLKKAVLGSNFCGLWDLVKNDR